MAPRIYALGDLAGAVRDLRVALQIMKKLMVRGPENAFAGGTETGLCRRPRFFRYFASCQQCFEIDALEFLASVNYEDLRHARMSPHALAQDHHAGTITGRVKCEVHGEDATRKSIGQKGSPGASQHVHSRRAN